MIVNYQILALLVIHLTFVQSLLDLNINLNNRDQDQSDTKQDPPICVIGGGLSGLSITNLLQNNNYNVNLYEAEIQFGGKAQTYRDKENNQIDKCPLIWNLFDTNTDSYMSNNNMTKVKFDPNDREFYDPEKAQFFPSNLPSAVEIAALAKYILIRATLNNQIEIGYKDATKDVFMTTKDWLKEHGLQELTRIFTILMTVEGYGDLAKTPAIYTLYYISAERAPILTGVILGAFTTKEGIDELVSKMASTIHNKFLNHTVTNVTSVGVSPNNTFLVYFNSNPTPQVCSKVIFAFPPLYSDLKNIMTDMTDEEKNVFEQVTINKYFSGGVIASPLNKTLYLGVYKNTTSGLNFTAPNGNGDVLAFIKQTHGSTPNVYSSYSWIGGEYGSGATNADLANVNTKLGQFLNKLSQTSNRILFSKSSKYFPHVNTASLDEGFYKNFNSIQGNRGIYYATTLWCFETMDCAFGMGEKLVKDYFTKKTKILSIHI